MKNRIAPLMIALLIYGALTVVGCKTVQEPVQSPAQKTKSVGKIEISEYGTLKRLNNSVGKSFPADPGETLGDGYAIGYKFTNAQTGKQEERFIYAVGDEKSDGLEIVPSEPTAPDANIVKRVVKTNDGALRLTHEIKWDETSRMVSIRRTIDGLSKEPVRLHVVKFHARYSLADAPSPSASQRCSVGTSLESRIKFRWMADASTPYFDQLPDVTPCPGGPENCHLRRGTGRRQPPIVVTSPLSDSLSMFKQSNIGEPVRDSGLQGGCGLIFYLQDGKNLQDELPPNNQSAYASISYYQLP